MTSYRPSTLEQLLSFPLKGALPALCVLRRLIAISSCIPELRLEENGGGESKKRVLLQQQRRRERGKQVVFHEKIKALLSTPNHSPPLESPQPITGGP